MKVQVATMRWIEVKRSARLRIAEAESKGLCCACMEPLGIGRHVRHCHIRCAKATYKAIADGLTTDEARVAEGKWLPAGPGGRPRSNPVSVDVAGK